MKCLETRQRDGMTYRRYLLDDGSTRSTYEVPASVVRTIGPRKFREAAAQVKRGEQRRALAAERTRRVHTDLAGLPLAEAARELGVSAERVRQLRGAA